MPLSFLMIASVLAAVGLLVGAFITVNVISSMTSSADKQISQILDDIGTEEFDQPVASTVKQRFTEKPKPATAQQKAEPKEATADAGGGDAAPAEAAAEGDGGGAGNDESLSQIQKVWIEEGCIVCDACVDAAPDVFVIEGDTCIIVPEPALDQVDEIKEAAAGCPVDVIRYS